MRAADVKPKTHLGFKVNYNTKSPKVKVGGYVRILNYKKYISKGYRLN